MASSKFYLRSTGENCTIQLGFNISQKVRLRASTGLKINSTEWSETTGLPKQKTPANKNLTTDLKNLSNHLESEFNADYTKGIVFSNDWLKNKINSFFNRKNPEEEKMEDDNLFSVYMKNYIDFRKLKGETKITTERKFNQLKTKYEKFEKKKRTKYLISEIDHKLILNFKKFMIDDLKSMESTANEIIRKLKTVLLNARDIDDKNIHKNINSLKISSTPATKVFLSFAEIEKIKKLKIVGNDLIHAKDWLIIGCYTGQRVSDLLRMRKEMIFTKTDTSGESYQFIELIHEKTGKEVMIPLHDEVAKVLDRYNGDFPPTFGKTGDSRSVLFNRYIKIVCDKAGINNIVKGKVFNETTKRNEITDTEKYKLVSSHICRRSFATNFYGDNRFTTAQLMDITGHKTESVFLSYIGKTSSDHAMKTAKTFREIRDTKDQKIAN
jgi:integrase